MDRGDRWLLNSMVKLPRVALGEENLAEIGQRMFGAAYC